MDSFLTRRRGPGLVESSSFWISPERLRGSREFRTCTLCGRNLFPSGADCLQFSGTHPRSVLCMPCKASQDARRFQWRLHPSPNGLWRRVRGVDSRRPTSIAVTSMSLILVSSVLAGSLALRSSQTVPELSPFAEVSDLVLVYVPDNQGQVTGSYLAPYVSHLGEDGERKEWLFDTFLFLATRSEDGSPFWGRTVSSQWEWWIEMLFRKDQQIDALNAQIDEAKRSLGKTSKRGVMVAIPYPSPEISDFGRRSRDGSGMNFDPRQDSSRSAANRLEACQWFCDEVVQRWEGRSFANLELVGFYWFQEELLDGDADLVSHLSSHIHDRGYGLYWIPYNSERNLEAVGSYRAGDLDLGFDYVWIQPNYAFRNNAGESWREIRDLDMIASAADELGFSIEIEVEERPFLNGDLEAVNSFYHYLDGGLTHYYMNKPLAYYVFPAEMYMSGDPIVRQCYDALCEFVKDRHQPISYLLAYEAAGEGDRRIGPADSRDFGPVQVVSGKASRLAGPGAAFSVEGLDPHKDVFLAMDYLTYHSGQVRACYGRDGETLGRLIGDGCWHTATWFIPVSGTSQKTFDIEISNLTWVSGVWVYPDETVFRLAPPPEGGTAPGLFTELVQGAEGWHFSRGDTVTISKMDSHLPWLLTLTYRANDEVGLRLSGERSFEEIFLDSSVDWSTVSFVVNPHEGSGDVLVEFGDKVQLKDMRLSPEMVRTNVGTAWDTNPQRHTPGVSLGRNWSASRSHQGEADRTYRTGNVGSTIVVHPFGSKGMLLTVEYRAERSVEIRTDWGELVATLPPAPGWGVHRLVLMPKDDAAMVLGFSGQIDLASAWVEMA